MSERVRDVGAEVNPARLENPVLGFLKTYWDEKRRDRNMPARADIDPMEMREHLGWLILADVLPGMTDLRFRLVGTRITQYFRRDITGRLLSESYQPYGTPAQKMAMAVYRKVARDQIVLRTFGTAGWLGKDFIEFDQLFVPLSDDGSTVNMVLSAFTFDYRRQNLARPSLL